MPDDDDIMAPDDDVHAMAPADEAYAVGPADEAVTSDWDDFPAGATLADGTYAIGELLHGNRDHAIYHGNDIYSGTSVLITLTRPQTMLLDDVARELTLPYDTISPLRYLGPLLSPYPGQPLHHALVEDRPPGTPLEDIAELDLKDMLDVCLQIAERAQVVHHGGHVVGGIRSELVYVERIGGDLTVTGLVPRAERFARTAVPPEDRDPLPLFDMVYSAPEILVWQPPRPASDVFSLCVLLAMRTGGGHPFAGEEAEEQVSAILQGRRWPWTGLPELGAIVDHGLTHDPEARLSLDELIAALRGLMRSR